MPFANAPTLPCDLTLLPPGERVLAAVSGGADSLALLLALLQAGRGNAVLVGHVNHGLRGAESDADEAFVVAHCQKLQLPVVTERVTVPGQDEAAARAVRYECLARLAQTHGCPRMATGHTATDALETVLLNWLRGAAVTGLCGIPPQRALAPGVLLVRPLLGATREQARAACAAAGWAWREDASNRDSRYRRNRVRHELLPLLGQLMPPGAGLEHLALQTVRASEILRADLEFLDEMAQMQLDALALRAQPGVLALDGARFGTLHPALQRRVLRAAARRVGGDDRDLDFALVEAVRRHVTANGRRAVWQWRRGLNVEWTGAGAGNRLRIWLVRNSAAPPGSAASKTP